MHFKTFLVSPELHWCKVDFSLYSILTFSVKRFLCLFPCFYIYLDAFLEYTWMEQFLNHRHSGNFFLNKACLCLSGVQWDKFNQAGDCILCNQSCVTMMKHLCFETTFISKHTLEFASLPSKEISALPIGMWRAIQDTLMSVGHTTRHYGECMHPPVSLSSPPPMDVPQLCALAIRCEIKSMFKGIINCLPTKPWKCLPYVRIDLIAHYYIIIAFH